MNINTFFATASPTTLASLVADIHCLGKGAEPEQLTLARRAEVLLEQNVGIDEAAMMIEDFCGQSV